MRSKILAGTTSLSAPIYVTNSAAGGGLGSLVFNTSGLVGEYRRQGASSWTSISLSAGTLGTWSSGGWIADGACTGAYEVGIPNAALASGAAWVAVRYYGAANMTPVLMYIELDAVNYQDGVRLGMTSLPNAAANANGGLPVLSSSGTTLAYTVSTLTTYAGNTPQTGDAFARVGALGAGLTSLAQHSDIVSLSTQIGSPMQAGSSVTVGAIGSGVITTATFAVGAINSTAVAANVLDGVIVEAGVNVPQSLSIIGAACAGSATGVDVGSPVYTGLNNATTRITATALNGNRSNITLNLPSE